MSDPPISFLDLVRLHRSVAGELDEAFRQTVDRSAFVGAGLAASFERALAEAHNSRGAVGCGSGTDALALALRAVGIGVGDEVIVPSMTFVATLEAVVHAGATPVIADVDPSTLLLNDEAVGAARTARTRAVIPVHLYGHVVPFEDLAAWRDSGLLVLEDAAQAHLATCGGAPVGQVGHAACFSFYPGKNLGALGDGGAVISSDDALLGEVRRLANHGRVTKYEHDVIGWCSRLDGLQAAFLEVKLRHLPEWTGARRRLAELYRTALGELLVPWKPGAVHHLLVVRIPNGRRSEVQKTLEGQGIETGVHYPVPLSRQESCAQWSRPCPVAECAADEVLSLPMDPLMTEGEVSRVCDTVIRALG